jgi:hypothetical protein
MNSERRKRQKEVERFLHEMDENHEADVAFQEEVRRTAAAIIEKETGRIQENERAKRRKWSITPVAAGVWLLVLGALGFILSMPTLAPVLFLCGVAVIAWATLYKPTKSSLLAQRGVKSYKTILKKSLSRFFKKTS